MAGGVVILSFLLSWLVVINSENAGNGESADHHMEMYKRLFELKRREQVQTAEQVWAVTDYEKQYKTIQLIEEAIFPVIKQSLLEVAEFEYIPGAHLPQEQEKREVIGKIYENVAFFGDILLRMPDKTKQIFRRYQNDWWPLLEEAVQFCNASDSLFTGPHATQLHLMSQEIGLIPEDEDYVNPYRHRQSTASSDFTAEKAPPKKKKKKRHRGPKLRSGARVDL